MLSLTFSLTLTAENSIQSIDSDAFAYADLMPVFVLYLGGNGCIAATFKDEAAATKAITKRCKPQESETEKKKPNDDE